MPPGDPSIPETRGESRGSDLAVDPDEELWEPLLLAIEEGRVIPVIGRDLYRHGGRTARCCSMGGSPSGWAQALKVGFGLRSPVPAIARGRGHPARLDRG